MFGVQPTGGIKDQRTRYVPPTLQPFRHALDKANVFLDCGRPVLDRESPDHLAVYPAGRVPSAPDGAVVHVMRAPLFIGWMS